MYRRRLSFAESDGGDIYSCSDIHTLNGGDEMNYTMNGPSRDQHPRDDQSRGSSLISLQTDIVTVDGPTTASTTQTSLPPDYLDDGPVAPMAGGFTADDPPDWPMMMMMADHHNDEFPSLAAAEAPHVPDQFPTLMRTATSPSTNADDEQHGDDDFGNVVRQYAFMKVRTSRHFSRSPPRTIMIGRDRSRSRKHRSSKLHDDDDDDDHDHHHASPATLWNTRLCGMRADRLIVLLAMILFTAVAVIVAALIYANRMIPPTNATNQQTANTADELSLTRTPIASPIASRPPPSALAPAGPTTTIGSLDATLFPTPTPIATLSPTTIPPVIVPTTPPPPPPPTGTPTSWARGLCGVDDTQAEFPVDDSYVNCAWVADSRDRSTVCAVGSAAHYFCRETCENCVLDDAWPFQVCGVDSPLAQIFVGPEVGTHSCEWVRLMFTDHGARLCDLREHAYHACRETCGNCGPLVLWPTMAPVVAPVVSPTPPPTTIQITATPIMQPDTAAPTVRPGTPQPTMLPTVRPPPTVLPTEAEDSVPDIRGLIVAALPATSVSLSLDDSPQTVTVLWMEEAFTQGAYLDLSDDRLLQIFTLATIAFSTHVDQWIDRQDWLSWSTKECQWLGITCENQRVVAIELPSNGLAGMLPPEIILLQDTLRVLVLSSNSIGGVVPTALGNLINLEELRIDRNAFSGTLPTSIGRLRKLRLFYLEHNPSIRGAFPASVVDMDSLVELVFYYTAISAITDEVCDLDISTLIFDCRQITTPTCWTRCFYLCGGNTGIAC